MGPGLPCIGRFVDAVASGQVGPLQAFAAADVNDVWVGGRNGNRANRAGGLIVKNRLPGSSRVGCLPHAAINGAHVEDIRLLRYATTRAATPATRGPNHPPAHFAVQVGIELLCGRGNEEERSKRADAREKMPERGHQNCLRRKPERITHRATRLNVGSQSVRQWVSVSVRAKRSTEGLKN